MMDRFDKAYDMENFFGYNSNTTVQQQSIQQFSICNETNTNNNLIQNKDSTRTIIVTVKEFSYLSSSSSMSTTNQSASSLMLDSIVSHPFFMQNSFRRGDHRLAANRKNSASLLSKCRNNKIIKKSPPKIDKKLLSMKNSLPKHPADISDDLFIFKKPQVPKLKYIKSNDEVDKHIKDNTKQSSADVDQIIDEKLNKKVTVQLKRLKFAENKPLEKVANECIQSNDKYTKKEIINKENISNGLKIRNKLDLNTAAKPKNDTTVLKTNNGNNVQKKVCFVDNISESENLVHSVYHKTPIKKTTKANTKTQLPVEKMINDFKKMNIELKEINQNDEMLAEKPSSKTVKMIKSNFPKNLKPAKSKLKETPTKSIINSKDAIKSVSKTVHDMVEKSNNPKGKRTKTTEIDLIDGKNHNSYEDTELKKITALIRNNMLETDLSKKENTSATTIKLTNGEKPVSKNNAKKSERKPSGKCLIKY